MAQVLPGWLHGHRPAGCSLVGFMSGRIFRRQADPSSGRARDSPALAGLKRVNNLRTIEPLRSMEDQLSGGSHDDPITRVTLASPSKSDWLSRLQQVLRSACRKSEMPKRDRLGVSALRLALAADRGVWSKSGSMAPNRLDAGLQPETLRRCRSNRPIQLTIWVNAARLYRPADPEPLEQRRSTRSGRGWPDRHRRLRSDSFPAGSEVLAQLHHRGRDLSSAMR